MNPLSVSVTFVLIELAFLIGIGLGDELPWSILEVWDWPTLLWWWAAIILAFLTLADYWPHPAVQRISLGLAMMLVGSGWALWTRTQQAPGPLPYGQSVTVTGQVVTFPRERGRQQQFFFETDALGQRTKILIVAGREPPVARGAQVMIAGQLMAPNIDQSFREDRWLEGHGAFAVIRWPKAFEERQAPQGLWAVLEHIRSQMITTFEQTLPEPAASLAKGLAVGVPPEIDPDLERALKITNLTHLAAVSGQNLSLFILLLFLFVRQWWLRGAVGLSLALLALYIGLVGGEASILRAGILASLVILAPLVGRPIESLRVLVLAATILTLLHPLSLTRDLGFQLSFMVFAGIVLLDAPLTRLLHRLPPVLRQYLIPVSAATLAVTPLQVVDFGTISPVGPLANLLVAFLVTAAMGGSLLLGLVGLVNLSLAHIVAFFVYLPLELIRDITLILSDWVGQPDRLLVPNWVKIVLLSSELVIFGWLGWRHIRRPLPVRLSASTGQQP